MAKQSGAGRLMAILIRRPDWPERLHEFIESRRTMPFAWGSNDCGLFPADAWLAMTDIDVAANLRGYKSERGALSRIKKAGGLRALLAASWPTEKRAGFASRGDVCLALFEDRETAGLVVGNGHWCGPGEDGLLFRPMADVVAIFGL